LAWFTSFEALSLQGSGQAQGFAAFSLAPFYIDPGVAQNRGAADLRATIKGPER
jgi:hypothetical protein